MLTYEGTHATMWHRRSELDRYAVWVLWVERYLRC